MATPKTLVVTVTFAANTPANMRKSATIIDGTRSLAEYVVSKGKVLAIKDVYIKDSADVGVSSFATLVVDDEDKAHTAPLEVLLVSNPSRPRIPPLRVDEFKKLRVDVTNLAAVGTEDKTVTFYIDVEEVPKVVGATRKLLGLQLPSF